MVIFTVIFTVHLTLCKQETQDVLIKERRESVWEEEKWLTVRLMHTMLIFPHRFSHYNARSPLKSH